MSIKRQKLRDKFSTFLTIHDAEGNSYSWEVDSKLQRNIDAVLALERYSGATEEEIVRHFLNELRHSDQRIVERSRSHLVAYLQETCYFVSKKLCFKFNRENAVENAFGIAYETICSLVFFERYASRISQLTTYASNAIKNRLLNWLTVDGRSIWGKYYHLSATGVRQIVISIIRKSYRDIEDYVYIHQFYKLICPPLEDNQARTEPNSEQLQAICNLYNSQIPLIKDQFKKKFVAIDSQEALGMMKSCINEILNRQRTIGSPKSLDAPINGNDDSDTTLGDVFEQSDEYQDHSDNDELSDLIEMQTGLGSIVDREILSFAVEQQSIFTLLHGFDCSMTKVGMLYGLNQSNISRRYTPICKEISAKCVIFCQQQVSNLNITEVWLRDLKQWLKDYLDLYYKNTISQLLESLISSYYQENVQDLHKFNNLTEYLCTEGDELLVVAFDLLINHLQQKFNITQSFQPIFAEINDFIKSWISDRPTN